MAQHPRASPSQLVGLPAEVLEHIFSHLSLQDRLRGVAGTCKAFCAILDSSRQLWQEGLVLEGSLAAEGIVQRAQLFQIWVMRRAPKLGVRRLTVKLTGYAGGGVYYDAERAWPFVFAALAAAAAGGTLRQLTLEWGSTLPEGPWLLSLAPLTSLTILARGVSLPEQLSALTSLSLLELDGSAEVRIDGLPSSLTSLSLHNTGITALPACISNLCSLEALWLSSNYHLGWADLGALTRLRSLRILDMSGCHLSMLPASLSSLQSLTMLALDLNPIGEEGLDAGLGGLWSLRYLALSSCGLRRAPALLGSPACQLFRLSLSGNNLTTLSAPGGSMEGYRSLRRLTVDYELLPTIALDLVRCPRLQELCIIMGAGEFGAGEVSQVVQALASHATLKQVLIVLHEGQTVGVKELQLLLRLARGVAHLDMDACVRALNEI